MRPLAPLALAALLLQGCVAYGLSGLGAGKGGSDRYEVVPEEPDARILCDGAPCRGVPVERPWTEGRSRGVFWGVFAVEAVGGFASWGAAVASFSSSPPIGAMLVELMLGSALLSMASADVLAYLVSDDWGRRDKPLRLGRARVDADWRGQQRPLHLEEVVPPGAADPPLSFSLTALGWSPPPPAPAPVQAAPGRGAALHGRVAVLDLRSSSAELAADVVRYFGDLVRSATLKAAPRLQVITRENLLVLLQSTGRDLADCEGECEVETGRRIGADAVISGELLKVGSHFKLSLRLHETEGGKLLGATVASGRTVDELDDAATRAVAQLFEAR